MYAVCVLPKTDQVICPFTFSTPRCNDVVQDIVMEEKYFIAVDTESGYWKLVAEEEGLKRLVLFTPNGNRRRRVMLNENTQDTNKVLGDLGY